MDAETKIETYARQLGGAWVAYYQDRSGIAIFGAEIDALRYAVDHSMQVQFCPWGSDPFTGLKAEDR